MQQSTCSREYFTILLSVEFSTFSRVENILQILLSVEFSTFGRDDKKGWFSMIYMPGSGVGNVGAGFGIFSGVGPGIKMRPVGIFGNETPAPNNDLVPSVDETRDIDPSSSAVRVSRSTLSPETVDYINAEYAKHYGMDRSTAYQEALANTAYQRSVADMQAAGLNPAVIFGAGRGSGADSFSGRVVSSRASGRGSSDNPFGLGDTASLIGSAAELITSLLTKNEGLARAVGGTAKNLALTVDKWLSSNFEE